MKVIAHVETAEDLKYVQKCLEYALSEPTLKCAGLVHGDGTASFFHKTDKGSVVIHLQR